MEWTPVLLDLRSPTDFAIGHLPGAINIPLSSLQASDVSPYEDSALLETQWVELECLFGGGEPGAEKWRDFEGRHAVLVCYGGDTAKVASSVLRARGVEAVSVRGGMAGITRWKQARS